MFLFSFNNSTCASSRDLTWLCVVIRIFKLHHVWYRMCAIGGSCTNCGVIRESDGLCARCLDLPYCKKCKRHLNQSSFSGEQRHICQVHLQIILFLHVAIACILHTGTETLQVGLLFHKSLSLSLHVLSSVYAFRTAKSGVPYDAPHSTTS